MIFGQIDYINLLPFHVFAKKYISSTQTKGIMRHKKSYPAKINNDFLNRKIDAGFISSIKSQKAKRLNAGIVAKKEVLSVLAKKNSTYKADYESSTSNVLAKILGYDNEVIIGNKALKLYLQDSTQYIDLAKEWRDRYDLPFVFAVLCVNKHTKYLTRLANRFVNSKVKIPYYILKKYEQNTSIKSSDILYYLTKISYQIKFKEKLALKKFFRLSKDLTNVSNTR